MNGEEQAQFRDPELKAAVVRARGGHVASSELRAEVLARFAEVRAELARGAATGGGEPSRMRIEPDASPLRREKPWYLTRTFFAAAAVLVLVIGSAGAYWAHLRHEEEDRQAYIAGNRTLLLAMIDAYNGSCHSD